MDKNFMGMVLSASLLTAVLLGGCASTNSIIEDAVVVSKLEENSALDTDYYIVVEKNGDSIELSSNYNTYRAVREGQTVDIKYDTAYYILKIEFPKLQEKDVDKNEE